MVNGLDPQGKGNFENKQLSSCHHRARLVQQRDQQWLGMGLFYSHTPWLHSGPNEWHNTKKPR